MVKKISNFQGESALLEYAKNNADKQALKTAVRFTLQKIADRYPGRSVEIRIPPYGATQILSGTTHRRGTPPAVVETDPVTWIQLCTGKIDWEHAVLSNKVEANGQRSDIGHIFPL